MELSIATPQGTKGTVAVSDVTFGKEYNEDLEKKFFCNQKKCIEIGKKKAKQ